jgi:heme/copper-type cytochrome/quinol oxidase subunit 3
VTDVSLSGAGLLAGPKSPRAEIGWWGMVVFCLTEGALFAYLIGSYFYLGVSNPAWPPAGIERPKLLLPLIMTALLLSSSFVLRSGEKAFERSALGRFRVSTLVTILLGLGFLLLQFQEYRNKLPKMGPRTHAYASIFYTITGFHGVHVLVGLLLLAWTFAREWTGNLRPQRPHSLKITSLYWHFVDGVWLVILAALYLSPRFYQQ